MKHAVIYAAGRGSRLGAGHEDGHKVLLEIGGRTLLERHVGHLRGIGVEKLTVVTGHASGLVEEELGRLRGRCGLRLASVHNPDYLEGSVLSFEVSIPTLEAAGDSVLLMDGDVLYAHAILERLARSPAPTALLIDRNYSTDDDDPVLVPMVDGRPVDFRKRWSGRADAVGESIGFFKVANADLPLLVAQTRARLIGEARKDSYDEVLREMVVTGRFGCVDVTGLPWTEIDFPSDLERARNRVLPAILNEDGTSDVV